MAGLSDAARAFAASGDGGMGMDVNSPDMESQDPNAPEEAPEQEGDQEFQQALSALTAAVADWPADMAERARTHIEALQSLSVEAEASSEGESPEEEGAEQPGAGLGNAGQIEGANPGGGPSLGGSPLSP